jgi:hypothetical protein
VKDHRKVGSVPLSVAGGLSLSGAWASREGFDGPMIGAPAVPRTGRGGLSSAEACPAPASVAVAVAAKAAAPVKNSRRWSSDIIGLLLMFGSVE